MKRPLLLDDAKPKMHPVLDFDNSTYYVGFSLPTMVKEKEKKIPFILSDNELTAMDEMVTEFRYGEIPEMERRISNKLLRNKSAREKDMALESAFGKVRKMYERYIDFSEPETYDFIALWAIGTYFFPMFYSYPYIHIHGLSGTGKTKVLEVSEPMCFNSLSSGNMSTPTLFRLVELYRPTLLIDETDALAKKSNRPEFRELLLNGHKKFGKAWRSIKKDEKATDYTPKPFDVFCPKMTANISGIEDVLASRAIRITMWRSKEGKYAEEIKPEDSMWIDVRDECYLALINEWDQVKMSYEQLEQDDMINRNWELWRPILSIAKLVSREVFSDVVRFARKRIEESETLTASEAPEYKLVKALFRLCYKDDWHNLKDIKRHLMNEFEESDGAWVTSHWTSKAMERLGFKKVREYAGYKQFYVKMDFLNEVMDRLAIKPDEIEKLEDKKIPNFHDRIFDFVKERKSPTHFEILTHFGGQGVNESDTEKILEKLTQVGRIYQPNPNHYEVV